MREQVRDKRTEQARMRIIKAATRLYISLGIRAVTMNDVAHKLKMSKRTIYELFSDKEMLLIGCYKYWAEIRNTRMKKLLSKTDDVLEIILSDLRISIDMMKRVSPDFMDEIHRYPKLIEFRNHIHTEREDAAVEFIKRGIAQGLFVPDVDCRVFLRTITSMGEFVARNPHLRSTDTLATFHSTFFFYLRGITTDKGRERIDSFAKEHFQTDKI